MTNIIPEAMTIKEVCAELRVSRRTLSRYIADGRMRAIKLGNTRRSPVLIPRAEVAAFIAACAG